MTEITKSKFELWKDGIKKITLIQQIKIQIMFNSVVMIGIVCGAVYSILFWKKLWWLAIILVASLGNVAIGQLGLWQKYSQIKEINKTIIASQIQNQEQEQD